MTPGRLVAPMSVRRDFQASPQWFANNPGAMDAVGDALLQQNQGIIQSWVQGQRQNARNANMQMWTNQLVLPGITAQYWNYAGNEILRLIATPENAAGSVSNGLNIDIAGIIKVRPEFNGWPIPGYPNTEHMVGWDPPDVYFWDPVCAPGLPGQDDAVLSVGAAIIQDGPWQTSDEIITFTNGHGFGDNQALSPLWFGANGYLPSLQTDIKAGSKVVPTPLAGRQYWEVKINALQTDVPADITVDGFIDHSFGGGINGSSYGLRLDDGFGGQGTITTSITFNVDLSGDGTLTRTFPDTLNTWLTPAIGVLPAHMVTTPGTPATGDTPAVIGIDDDPTIRSIGAVPISYMWDPVTVQDPHESGGVFTGYTDASPNPDSPSSSLAGNGFMSWKTQFTFLPGANSLPVGQHDGRSCPVIVGRADLIWDLEDPTDPGTTTIRDNAFRRPDINSHDLSKSNFSGYFPGIDLGELKEHDVVMVATDANTGEIWFGKNGKWYGQDGPLAKFPKTSNIKMDVGANAINKYYAAVSWRVGGGSYDILLGLTQSFSPPAGFSRLTPAPSFAIPLPDSPA